MGFFNKEPFIQQGPSKPEPQKTEPKPELPLNKKEHPFLFPGSREYIKGKGGLEEDLIRILRTEPDKVAQLNKKLRSYKLPPVYRSNASKIAKEIIERKYSPEARRDNKIEAH